SATLLRVVVGEHHSLMRDAVDVRRAIAHHAERVGADVRLADVVASEHDDVGLLAAGRRRLLRLSGDGERKPERNDRHHVPALHDSSPCYFWKAKTLFQSDFILTTIQCAAFASSQARSSLPMCDWRS